MSYLEAIFLGILQGLTEFLPVSSSAHLILAETLFGTGEPDLLFSVLLHLGTLGAVLTAYRDTVRKLLRETKSVLTHLLRGKKPPETEHRRLLSALFIALIPLLLIYPLKSRLTPLLLSPVTAGICLLFNGGILLLCAGIKNPPTKKELKLPDALFVGILQCAAILPGLSRSGTTVTAGLCRGWDKEQAAEFSFLLSVPTILGGAVTEIADALSAGVSAAAMPGYLLGTAAAALSGFGAIRLFRRFLKSNRFFTFAIYSFAVGALTLWLTA